MNRTSVTIAPIAPWHRIRLLEGYCLLLNRIELEVAKDSMNRAKLFVTLLILASSAWALPLGSAARTVIPSDIQQIISVDYRAMKGSNTAMALT